MLGPSHAGPNQNHLQASSTTRNGLPPWSLCLCGSRRLLGCFISNPSASISGPGCCPGILESHAKTPRRKGRKPGSLARSTTRNGRPPWSPCLCASVPLWFKTAAWLFHQQSISNPSASISGPVAVRGSSSLTQRRKDAKGENQDFSKIHYQERASSVVSESLCLCGSRRLLGCFISGPSASISGPALRFSTWRICKRF